ncbi:MAG: TonB-dependent receptor [Acidobacteriota bacterium]
MLFAVLAAAVLLLGAPAAHAQGNLDVSVVSADSFEPLGGILVELSNDVTGLVRQEVTSSQGRVIFRGLTTGSGYRIRNVDTEGFGNSELTGITLRANAFASVTLRLSVQETFEDEVSVSAAPQLVALNTVNAEVSSTLVEQELSLLPVEGRDLTRSLYRLPNVSQATGFYPEAPNVSVNGANSLYVNYLIDGLDNNENFLGGQKFAVPLGAVQDVTVLTSTYTAEFGRTGNGVFNVTSKSGTNQLRGDVFYLSRPGASVDASSPFAGRDLSGNAVRDGFARDQFGISIGGPIAEDQTFFFLNVENTLDDKDNLLNVPELGINETVAGENEFLYATARLDHRFSDSFQSSLRVNWGDIDIERQGGGLEGGVTFPSAGNTQDRDSYLAALRTSFVTENLVNEADIQFSRFRWNYARPNNEGPQVNVLGAAGQTIAVLGHPGFIFDNREETVQIQDRLSLLLGDHTVKLGASLITSDFELFGGGNVDGNYLVQLTQAQQDALASQNLGSGLSIFDIPSDVEVVRYDVELQPRSFGETQDFWSVFAEDTWAVNPNLTLTAGLRWDYDSLSEGGSSSGDSDNIAPRLAANYRIDDRSTVRAGFGVFYDKILYAVYSDALQQSSTAAGFRSQIEDLIALGILPADTDIDQVLFNGNLGASFDDVPYLGGPTPGEIQGQREDIFSNERRILNPNGYDNPVTEQYSLGFQRQLRDDMLFYVDFIHTRSYNLFRLRDLNAPAPFPIDPNNVQVRTQEEADATRPVALRDGGARNIVISEAEGEARYRAATFTLVKSRSRDNYNFRLSYTLSKLENNTDDINFRAQDSNNFGAEWGPSLNDRTHVISGIFQYHPTDRFSVSAAVLLQSGQPINRIPDARIFGTTDLNGDGRSFGDAYVGNSDRQPGEARNSDRLPWSEVLDLSLQYSLPIAGRNIDLRVDVFNVLNETNLSGFSNNATQSNQIQVGPRSAGIERKNAGPPRQFQFGVSYAF